MSSEDEIKIRKSTKKSRKKIIGSNSSLSDIDDKVTKTLNYIEKSYTYIFDQNEENKTSTLIDQIEENKTPNLPQSKNTTKLVENSKVVAASKNKKSAKRSSSDNTSNKRKSAKKCKPDQDKPQTADKKVIVDTNQAQNSNNTNHQLSDSSSNQNLDKHQYPFQSTSSCTNNQNQKVTTPNTAIKRTLSIEVSRNELPETLQTITPNQSPIRNSQLSPHSDRNCESPSMNKSTSLTSPTIISPQHQSPNLKTICATPTTPKSSLNNISSSSSSPDVTQNTISAHNELKAKFNKMKSSMPTNKEIKDQLDKQEIMLNTILKEVVTIKVALKRREATANMKIESCKTSEEFLIFEENLKKDVGFQEKVVSIK